MRHLFVPACLCLMTWSGATGPDPKMSLEPLPGSAANKSAAETGNKAVSDPVNVQIPIDPYGLETMLEPPAAEPQFAMPERVPLPPIAKPVVQRSVQEVCDSLTEAAKDNDLPVPFFIRLLFQESGFNPAVVSSAGAQGIAQFMPETAADMGVKNPFDPLQAIPASARLLRNLVAQFGNLGLAAAAYNAGPRRVQDWLAKLSDKNKKADKKIAEKKTAEAKKDDTKDAKSDDKADAKTDAKKDDKADAKKGDKPEAKVAKTAEKKSESKPKLPEETQGYVKTITGRPVENWTLASAALPGPKLPRHAPCQEAAGLYAWSGPDAIPLPPASPLAHREARSHAVLASLHAVKLAQQKPHETPVIAKAASQQLAARKRKDESHKLAKVAQR